MHLKVWVHILKVTVTSVRPIEKPLVVARIFIDCFMLLVIVLHDSCTLTGKETPMKPGQSSLWPWKRVVMGTFKNMDLNVLVLSTDSLQTLCP